MFGFELRAEESEGIARQVDRIGLRRRKMIGHIAALDTSAAYASAPLGTSGGGNSPQVGGPVSGPQSAQTVMSTQINAQVARLLQGIGGGAESNQLLQLMIGLMILITLLQGSQGQAPDPMKDLAGLSGGRAAAAGTTATSFTIEQTTVTW